MEENLTWKFSQCFGDKSDTLEVAEADIISTVKFDRTGDYLASGDRAGRVVLFQRNHSKRNCEYRFYTEFQSHEPEFDYLKSLEINERINKITWCKPTNDALFLLTTNDKTIKLWKVKERQVQAVVENNLSLAQKLICTDVRLPLMLPKLVERDPVIAATPRKLYANAHAYHIHSISLNSDDETFLSADDLRVNLWNLHNVEQSFNVVDIKPASIEELTEVITTAHFHPQHCHLFAYGTSKGYVRLCDMRAAALCDRHAKVFRREEGGTGAGAGHSFFSELISSISDLSFSHSGRQFVSRDYLTLKVWDLAMETAPLLTIPVHNVIRPRLCDLYESDAIFDKFECSFNWNDQVVATGSYSNILRFTELKSPPSAAISTMTTNSIADMEVGSTELIQADKSIFKNGRKTSKGKLASASLHLPAARLDGPFSSTPSSTTLSSSSEGMELDFDRKILHATLHPCENTVALAALSNLFIFSAQDGSNTALTNTAFNGGMGISDDNSSSSLTLSTLTNGSG